MPGIRTSGERWLLRGGVWAGPVFTAVFLAEGAVREDYRPLRHPVSSLALGPRGWVQTANFVVTGALCLAGAAGLRRAGDPVARGGAGPALVAVAGTGLLTAAAFPTDPVAGYPPGTPETLTPPSRTGIVHSVAGVLFFFGLPAAALGYGWRSWRAGERPGLAAGSAVAAVTMPVAAALAAAGFTQVPRFAGRGGLFQRVSIVAGLAWLTAASARALRRTR